MCGSIYRMLTCICRWSLDNIKLHREMCELEIYLVTVVLIWSGVRDTLGSVCEEWSPSIFNLWLVRFVRDRCLNILADVTKLSRNEERPLDKQPPLLSPLCCTSTICNCMFRVLAFKLWWFYIINYTTITRQNYQQTNVFNYHKVYQRKNPNENKKTNNSFIWMTSHNIFPITAQLLNKKKKHQASLYTETDSTRTKLFTWYFRTFCLNCVSW